MDSSLLRSFRVPMMMPKSDLDYNPISPIIIDSTKPWERSVNSFSHSREGYDCLGNYVLNEITHERASRKFNKFMSIITLNDSIILALMLSYFEITDSENYEPQSVELMGLRRMVHEAYGTWCDGSRGVWCYIVSMVLLRCDVDCWGRVEKMKELST